MFAVNGQLNTEMFGETVPTTVKPEQLAPPEHEADDVAERPTLGDASSYKIESAYTAALNHYFASQLNVEMDRPYITSNEELGSKWRWRDVPDGKYVQDKMKVFQVHIS